MMSIMCIWFWNSNSSSKEWQSPYTFLMIFKLVLRKSWDLRVSKESRIILFRVYDHCYDPCALEDVLYMHTQAVITRIRELLKNEAGMRIWADHVVDILGVEGRKGKVNVILFCCMSSWYSKNKNSLKYFEQNEIMRL